MKRLLLLAPLFLSLLACASDPDEGPTPDPSPTPAPSASPRASATPAPPSRLRVPGEVQEVFDLDCTSCHRAPGGRAGLNLDAAHAYESLVERKSRQATDRMIVAPGEPKASYLLNKMLGTHLDVGGHGARMPINGTWGVAGTLSDAEIERVRLWIAAGAPAEASRGE